MKPLSRQLCFIIRVLPANPALIFHLTFQTDFGEWLKKVFTDFICGLKANNDTEAAGPKRRSERLQGKPQTPKSEPKPKVKKAPAKGKKAKEVEKAKPEEKEDAKPETESEEETPAENGETKDEGDNGEAGGEEEKAD
ncbi:high mobility group nucleosome-binding domain-containing protein 3-like isoform X1 [Sinocyclocheilus grahami]|uniref:high mobility group nucleosome-binding domain-containing protein 3-like isoform X1 n=1 Tax=Sinocyclocheilus grahami TaxID=75366 RepID=UPI0007AC699E|nr:PREDICTED: high mobility group nucleosome-binding domain-containing protein 3-like isoform X1 [Sinocyclocheilus grahami]